MNWLRSQPTFWLVTIALVIALPLSIMVAVTFGTVPISFHDVYRTLISGPWSSQAGADPIHDVVWLIRQPRLILAMAVGMSLSVCGLVMQATVKNPLADPYILGVSSGASLGATLAILLGVGAVFGRDSVGVMGFLGAFGAAMLVMGLANIGGRSTAVKLLLAGTAVSAVCGSFSSFIVYLTNEATSTQAIVAWAMGSLAGARWTTDIIVTTIVLICTLFFWTQYRTLNLMLFGDHTAITLGTNLHRWRLIYLVVASLMIGFCVYSAGMIGFVGLVIPHIVRMVTGTDHKKLVPLSALTGAIFLIWADVLCRIILPKNEIPIGVLTSMIGAPVFIYLMARRRYGFGGNE